MLVYHCSIYAVNKKASKLPDIHLRLLNEFADAVRVAVQLHGEITYNDEPFKNFYPERTAAYVDQVSLPQAAA